MLLGDAMRPLPFLASLAAFAALLCPTLARAQAAEAPAAGPPPVDYLFPKAFRGSASIATGVPFILMSELALGLHDRVAIGALGGIALSGDGPPSNTGFGVRPRVEVLRLGDFRAAIVAPVLYYPKAHSSWFLARPEAIVERRFRSGAAVGVGLGLVAVASRDSLTGAADPSRPFMPYGGTPGTRGGDASNGVWNTVSIDGAIPLTARTFVQGQAALVLRGVKLPGDEWVGGVPFTLTLGVTTAL